MPEGDTLYRIAENLRPVLEGRVVQQAISRASPSVDAIDAESLVGHTVASVEARGKHLMLSFDDQRVVHSHLGMNGSWHVYPIGEPWRKPARQAGLALRTDTHEVVNFNPKLLELVTTTKLRRNDYLARLGPDMMLPQVDFPECLARLRVHNQSPVGEAVMNQTILAGIGNVYKSETLFIHRLNPWSRVGELSDRVLLDYLRETHLLMRRNRDTGPRITRFARDGVRHWVYGRSGQACFECEEEIKVRRQGDAGRTTYYCPRCQAVHLRT